MTIKIICDTNKHEHHVNAYYIRYMGNLYNRGVADKVSEYVLAEFIAKSPYHIRHVRCPSEQIQHMAVTANRYSIHRIRRPFESTKNLQKFLWEM